MKILIDIPEEFETDYTADKFKEFFGRVIADMDTLCGTYEKETAGMFIKAFEDSKLYDPDKVLEQLEEHSNADEAEQIGTIPVVELTDAIKIVKGGGVDG